MNVIYPKRTGGRWYFEGPAIDALPYYFNLLGMNDIIERIAADIPGAESGFKLSFDNNEFAGYRFRLERGQARDGGYWYFSPELKLMGWLGSELKNIFGDFPERIYANYESMGEI